MNWKVILILILTLLAIFSSACAYENMIGTYSSALSMDNGSLGCVLVITDTRTGSYQVYRIGLGDGEQCQITSVP